MRFRIVYDKPKRLRVRFGRYRFKPEHGYAIEAELLKNPAVLSANVTVENGGVLVLYQEGSRDEIINYFRNLDSKNLPKSKALAINYKRELDSNFARELTFRILSYLAKKIFLPMPLKILLTIVAAIPFWREGLKSILRRRLNVSVLDATAIFVSVLQRNYTAASSITALLGISEVLEDYTKKKARQTLTESLALNIDGVWRIDSRNGREGISSSEPNSELVFTPISDIKLGDVIRVYTGYTIPLDGEVFAGEAIVNESSMTGEPHGIQRTITDSVFAGCVIEEGNLDIKVSALVSDTRINNIITLIDSSEELKAGIQSKAENLADNIAPFSFLASAITFALTRNVAKATSVLTVDYSCALKLTTPICIISAMHTAAKQKILVKGGKHLESFMSADTIVFDKTGTLTQACPKVAKVIPFGGLTREEALRTAACLEEHFPHSVAKAIVKKAQEENLGHREEHTEPEYIVAHGISSKLNGKKVLIGSRHFIFDDEKVKLQPEQEEVINENAEGYSTVYLAINGELAGLICIDDPVRDDAKVTIKQLKELGISNVVMLTGDSEFAAKRASDELCISRYYAGVLPEEKYKIIKKLKSEGHKVIMVGDGINDSPALSEADVSVAMMDGSDIAKEVADIALLAENLSGLITLRKLSVNIFEKINKNYRNILAINTALLLFGATGAITPDASAALHNGATMLLAATSADVKL